MAEVMIQEKEDAAAWLSTLHGEELMQEAAVPKKIIAEETTKSGIVLPGSEKEKPQMAEVVAVGPGTERDGKKVEMQVKPGDKVIYSQYSGTNVKLEEEEFIIVSQKDIAAIVED